MNELVQPLEFVEDSFPAVGVVQLLGVKAEDTRCPLRTLSKTLNAVPEKPGTDGTFHLSIRRFM